MKNYSSTKVDRISMSLAIKKYSDDFYDLRQAFGKPCKWLNFWTQKKPNVFMLYVFMPQQKSVVEKQDGKKVPGGFEILTDHLILIRNLLPVY